MKVVKPQRLAVLTRPFEAGPECWLGVATLVLAPFSEPRKLLPEVALWKLAAEELGKDGALDAGMPKTRGEYLVAGKAFAPRGQATVACAVRAQVGTLRKELRVVGDRFWKGAVPTDAAPFKEMPVDWAHAFGGEGYAQNPLGKGAAPVTTQFGEVVPLPNVEDPRRLLRSPRDRPAPAGFGPIDLSWPQRMKKAGTYDKKWLQERFPGLAADVDWTFFNVASEDQWSGGPFLGDEAFAFEGLHPSKPRVEGRLPKAVSRCFLNVKTTEGEAFREVPMRLDTLWFFPHLERAVLVYHGQARIAEDDAADVQQLVAALEDPAAPRQAEHYRRVLVARLDKEKGALLALRDGDLMPDWPASKGPTDEEREQLALVEPKMLVARNLRRKVEREIELRRAAVKAAGLDPDVVGPKPLPPEPPPPSPEELVARVEEARATEEALRARAKEAEAAREAALKKLFADQGLDPEKALAEAKAAAAGPPRFRADAELGRLRALAEEGRKRQAPIPQIEAMLADPELPRRLADQERKLREGYCMTAHQRLPAGARPGPGVREEVLAAFRKGESLAGRDLTGADLAGVKLPGVDLTGAFLESARLGGADLSGARLEGAVLAHADLSGASLAGAQLARANLGAADLRRAKLAGAGLERAILAKSDLREADLAKAELAGADLSEAKLAGASFAGARASGVAFLKTDLSLVAFTGADLTKCIFLEVGLEAVDFSGAKLAGATFLGVHGEGARFGKADLTNARFVRGCDLPRSDFHEAVLEVANLRETRLSGADLSGARLAGADLSGCDLAGAKLAGAAARGARLVRANLTDARLAGADLMEAIAQKAVIRGADLRGANLFRADLGRAAADGRTSLTGANLTKVNVLPQRKA